MGSSKLTYLYIEIAFKTAINFLTCFKIGRTSLIWTPMAEKLRTYIQTCIFNKLFSNILTTPNLMYNFYLTDLFLFNQKQK